MESNQFDRLTRLVSSRRSVGLALGAATLLGLADAETAKRKKKRRKKPCKRFKVNFCGGGNTCATFKSSTCGDKKHCTCLRDQTCLPNEGCGLACPTECPQERGSCSCPASGDQFCVRDDLACEHTPTQCDSIADCPIGTACAETACGPEGAPEKRCALLCHPVP